LIDVYPTIAGLAGLKTPPGLDGASLRPLLENPRSTWDRPALTTYGRGNHAVRNERWAYIRYHDGSEELYNRRQDPDEWINLASQPGLEKVKDELRRALPSMEAPGESIPVGVL
jgi:arylsulfatase A-like enzyme